MTHNINTKIVFAVIVATTLFIATPVNAAPTISNLETVDGFPGNITAGETVNSTYNFYAEKTTDTQVILNLTTNPRIENKGEWVAKVSIDGKPINVNETNPGRFETNATKVGQGSHELEVALTPDVALKPSTINYTLKVGSETYTVERDTGGVVYIQGTQTETPTETPIETGTPTETPEPTAEPGDTPTETSTPEPTKTLKPTETPVQEPSRDSTLRYVAAVVTVIAAMGAAAYLYRYRG